MDQSARKFDAPQWLFAMGEIDADGEPIITRSFVKQIDTQTRFTLGMEIKTLPTRVPPPVSKG